MNVNTVRKWWVGGLGITPEEKDKKGGKKYGQSS
jgi:hypothetical protein